TRLLLLYANAVTRSAPSVASRICVTRPIASYTYFRRVPALVSSSVSRLAPSYVRMRSCIDESITRSCVALDWNAYAVPSRSCASDTRLPSYDTCTGLKPSRPTDVIWLPLHPIDTLGVTEPSTGPSRLIR